MPAAPPPPAATLAADAPARRQIGVARMQADGTITMELRVAAGQGTGDGRMSYAPGDPDYARVRAHLPGLAPGTPVPVYDDWE